MKPKIKDELIQQQIREAARGLFQKWGLQKTTMEDIAKAAHKGKSTLYYYFKSKDEIFDEIATEEFNAIFLKAQAAMQQQASAEDKLRAYLLSIVDEARQRALMYEVVFGEISTLQPVIARLREQQSEKQIIEISGILADGVRSGELKLLNNQDIQRLSTVILLVFKTLMFEYGLTNAFEGVTDMMDITLKAFMGGLRS
ncbi:MAG: helix-turn-helix domain containing protein [bacterium]|nr:helix-turn-helix domain containing protein [bacterium]